jgi:hypothetical protein
MCHRRLNPETSFVSHNGVCSLLAQFQADGEGTLFRLDLIVSREVLRVRN